MSSEVSDGFAARDTLFRSLSGRASSPMHTAAGPRQGGTRGGWRLGGRRTSRVGGACKGAMASAHWTEQHTSVASGLPPRVQQLAPWPYCTPRATHTPCRTRHAPRAQAPAQAGSGAPSLPSWPYASSAGKLASSATAAGLSPDKSPGVALSSLTGRAGSPGTAGIHVGSTSPRQVRACGAAGGQLASSWCLGGIIIVGTARHEQGRG
jgi:hypothetical protein